MTTILATVALDQQQVEAISKFGTLVLSTPNILLAAFLLAMGVILKNTKYPNWAIVFTIPLIGSLFGIGLLTKTLGMHPMMVSLMLGCIDGVCAVFSHQVLKQTLESPLGTKFANNTLVAFLAVLVGAEIPKEKPTAVPTPPVS